MPKTFSGIHRTRWPMSLVGQSDCHSHFKIRRRRSEFWIRFGDFQRWKRKMRGAWVCVNDLELAVEKKSQLKNEFFRLWTNIAARLKKESCVLLIIFTLSANSRLARPWLAIKVRQCTRSFLSDSCYPFMTSANISNREYSLPRLWMRFMEVRSILWRTLPGRGILLELEYFWAIFSINLILIGLARNDEVFFFVFYRNGAIKGVGE